MPKTPARFRSRARLPKSITYVHCIKFHSARTQCEEKNTEVHGRKTGCSMFGRLATT